MRTVNTVCKIKHHRFSDQKMKHHPHPEVYKEHAHMLSILRVNVLNWQLSKEGFQSKLRIPLTSYCKKINPGQAAVLSQRLVSMQVCFSAMSTLLRFHVRSISPFSNISHFS